MILVALILSIISLVLILLVIIYLWLVLPIKTRAIADRAIETNDAITNFEEGDIDVGSKTKESR